MSSDKGLRDHISYEIGETKRILRACLTMMPPRLWHMNIIGRPSSSRDFLQDRKSSRSCVAKSDIPATLLLN